MVNLVEVSDILEKEVVILIKCLSKYKNDKDAILIKMLLKNVMQLSNDLKKLRTAISKNRLLRVYMLLPKILDKLISLRKQTDGAFIMNNKLQKCMVKKSKHRTAKLKTLKRDITTDHQFLVNTIKHRPKNKKRTQRLRNKKKLFKGTKKRHGLH